MYHVEHSPFELKPPFVAQPPFSYNEYTYAPRKPAVRNVARIQHLIVEEKSLYVVGQMAIAAVALAAFGFFVFAFMY